MQQRSKSGFIRDWLSATVVLSDRRFVKMNVR